MVTDLLAALHQLGGMTPAFTTACKHHLPWLFRAARNLRYWNCIRQLKAGVGTQMLAFGSGLALAGKGEKPRLSHRGPRCQIG